MGHVKKEEGRILRAKEIGKNGDDGVGKITRK